MKTLLKDAIIQLKKEREDKEVRLEIILNYHKELFVEDPIMDGYQVSEQEPLILKCNHKDIEKSLSTALWTDLNAIKNLTQEIQGLNKKLRRVPFLIKWLWRI
jgi:hypothetical protein